MTRRTTRALALATVLAVGAAAPLRAQASPYVPLDDAAYAYVDALQARGLLPGLSLTERPYSAAALLKAIDASAPAGGTSGVTDAWLAALRARVARHLPRATEEPAADGVALVGAIGARLTGQTTARRELALADDDAAVHPGGELRVGAVTGPVVLGARYALDQRWTDDPDFEGFDDGGVAGRVEEGYLAGQWRYGELFFGRLSRRWGPGTLPGLQVGDAVPSYDHLHGRLGTRALHLATIVARLDDTPGLFAPRVQRFLAVHRLAGAWRGVEAALTESYVYSGADRGLEPSLVNPLAPALLTHYNEDQAGNVIFGAEAAWRTRAGVFGVQGMLDDYQFEEGAEETDEPPSYGLTLSAEGLPLPGEHRWFASYTRVSNLAYRTPEPGDNHVRRGVGLGRPFADYDETRLGLDLAVLPWAPARLSVLRRRQGEGDYRAPFPAVADYDVTPAFLAGEVATVTRIALETGGAAGGLAWRLDAGYNRVRGAGTPIRAAQGSTPLAASGLAGRVTVTWEPGLLRFVMRDDAPPPP